MSKEVMKQYLKLRNLFLCRNNICQVCNESEPTQVHHTKGRGKFLMDTESWLAVCFFCHEKIHAQPKWARENNYLIYGKDEK